MNISLLSKIQKNKYKIKTKSPLMISDNIVLIVQIILSLSFLFYRYFINYADNYVRIGNIFAVVTLTIAYLCILLQIIYIKYRKKKSGLKSAQNHHDYVNRSFLGIILVSFLIVGLILFIVNNGYLFTTNHKTGLYYWLSIMYILGWIGGYYLKSIVLFGEKSYYSGKYIIDYSFVTQIKIVKEYNTLVQLYLVEVHGKDSLIGMDKLFFEEYQVLICKIQNSQN